MTTTGVVKAYLADITNSENRAYAFGIIGGSFGIGIVLGSMMGGILIVTNDVDVPDDEYIATTSILKWSIFEEQFPFLLPTGVIGGIVAMNSMIWTYLFIVEERESFQSSQGPQYTGNSKGTNHNLNESLAAISDVSVHSVEMASNLSAPHYSSTNGYHDHETNGHSNNGHIALEHVHDGEYLAAHQSLPTFAEFQAMTGRIEPDKMKLLDPHKDVFDDDDGPYISSAADMFKVWMSISIDSCNQLPLICISMQHTHLGHSLLAYGITGNPFLRVLFQPVCLMILVLFVCTAISHMMFKEMGPVFMAQALLFDSAFIGYTQAYSGAVLFIFVFFIQPWILRKYDNKWLSGIGSALCVIALVWMPSLYYFTRIDAGDSRWGFMTDPIWLLIMVFIVEHTLTCAVSPVFVIATCWVNNSVPQYCLGKANGIGQTLAAFVRGFGPLLTGFIWSESYVQIEDGISYAVYWAYLPGALLFIVAIADNILSIPCYLNLTWEQRKRDRIK